MKVYRWWLNKYYSLLIIVSAFCIGVSVSTPFPALAMEPPRPGEIDKLKAEGKYMRRLETVKQIGNHRADPYRLKRAAIKLQRKILESRGMTESEIDQSLPLPPPVWRGMPSTGTVRTFALLIEFQDHMHTVNPADINNMLYGAGDSSDYPRESLASYYERSSYGLLDLSQGMTLGWYQTSYDRSAVVNTTAGRQNLIKEALNHYDSVGHDFSVYDNDGDGDIDYFIVMWTGPDAGWGSFWWGYMTQWRDGSYTLDGKKLKKYSWQWESDSPVVVIHETGHALGLPDLYDYNVDVGPDGGVGGFDMMDATRGDHNCFSKWLLDWITPMVVAGGRQGLELDAAASSTDAVIIWPGIGPGDIFSEFFIIYYFLGTTNKATTCI